ncbi:hypothetical protein D3C81_1913830 [compost metagenome]
MASLPFSPTVARRIALRAAVPMPSPTKRMTFFVFEEAASAGLAGCAATTLVAKSAPAAVTVKAVLNLFFF